MNQDRHLLRVSCKCALFLIDGSRVLLADYGDHGYGLPGGHIEANETPDEVMQRELFEELGLTSINARRADFFIHPNGKVVLGYVAQIEESTQLKIQLEEIDDAVWVDVSAIREGAIEVPSYKDFILAHQPNGVASARVRGRV